MTYPRILAVGRANPPIRLTPEQAFYAAGYKNERIRKIFLNSDIEYRHFYFGSIPNHLENSDQMNQRYLSGAVKTGCHWLPWARACEAMFRDGSARQSLRSARFIIRFVAHFSTASKPAVRHSIGSSALLFLAISNNGPRPWLQPRHVESLGDAGICDSPRL